MCGITGRWCASSAPAEELRAVVDRMRDTLAHRGPDGVGTWVDEAAGVALAQRRLAIQDLSPEGAQPMVSASGRYVLTYNGEVYNVRALREALAPHGYRWRGHSDTELMLAAFEVWGVADAVTRFVGMFAFGLWDRETRTLWLGRDRLGIKPMYYGFVGDALTFGSELKALEAAPGWAGTIDREALAAYFRYGYVPGPRTIWSGVHKLAPGMLVAFRAPGHAGEPVRYWSALEVAREARAAPFRGTDEALVEALDAHLRDAVKLRMLSDVPLGAFLSGGIDSSTVVALMQAQSGVPVKTFSIGYREAAYDEASHARAVAQHLGTDHTELVVSPEDALATIPSLPLHYDEPFADSSQIPTLLVSRLARTAVTVALSGDGGDEVFGGYNRHLWGPRVWRGLGGVPPRIRRGLGRVARAVPPQWVDRTFAAVGPALPRRLRLRVPGEKLHKLGSVLGATSEAALYRTLCSHDPDPLGIVLADAEAPAAQAPALDAGLDLAFAEVMMLLDLTTYLPDDILTKVDRASMAVSLEARVPLIDHRVVAFAWSLPLHAKLRGGVTKWALRQVLSKYVPSALWDREKSGFGVPIDAWLRGPLVDWAESLLDPARLRREGFLRPEPVRALWETHRSGRANTHHRLWDLLMFQAWLEGRA